MPCDGEVWENGDDLGYFKGDVPSLWDLLDPPEFNFPQRSSLDICNAILAATDN